MDSHFIEDSPPEIIKNSAIDAVAQCSEGYDSKNSNLLTKFLCNKAFELLEEGIIKMDKEKIVLGSLISGLGFGNASTTLGHALSYVFSGLTFPFEVPENTSLDLERICVCKTIPYRAATLLR